jgi:LPXTG-site transpeptidase (sortase) family protein
MQLQAPVMAGSSLPGSLRGSDADWRFIQIHAMGEQLLERAAARCARLLLSSTLLALGSTLCLYVCGSYVWMYGQQRKLLHEWSRAAPGEVLTKIYIPKIHLEAVVLEGASAHTLLRGPARLTQSALPGTKGNLVIAGHRDTFFRQVHSLRFGDDIYVMRGGERFHYTVIGRKVVEPSDLSVLRPSNEGHLTLITCFPTNAIGPAPRRLIVIARLAGEQLIASSRD